MISVAIVGVSGFAGAELIKILMHHKNFEITYLANSSGDSSTEKLHPFLDGVYKKDVSKASAREIANLAEVALLALPHKESMGFAKELLSLGVKVIDLSADYRLDLENYESNYCAHTDKENLSSAGYGLVELFRESLKQKTLIASPGCYPTASLLGMAPFFEYIEDGEPIYLDAKSGVSGAGKKCITNTHFVTVNENMFAYSPLKHRHSVEIEEKSKLLSNKTYNINFVPQLIPITRGMVVSMYAKLDRDIDPKERLREFYKNEPFIRIKDAPVQIKHISGTHFCDMYADIKKESLYVCVVIDNLLRGASSQAVAAMNIMFSIDEGEGLPKIAYAP